MENRALTAVVEISPSSSIMNIPVTSPADAVEASKTLGLLNVNVAIPDDPSFARVNLTFGTTFSSNPRTNWIEAASKEVSDDFINLVTGGNGAKACAKATPTVNIRDARRRRWFVIIGICLCWGLDWNEMNFQ